MFLAGGVTSIAFSLPFIAYPTLSSAGPEWLVLVLASGFCANLIAYLIGLVIAVNVKTSSCVNGFLFAFVVVGYLGGGVWIEWGILHHPDLVIVLTTVTAGATWLWLRRPAWFRNRCSVAWVGLLDPWDRSKMQKFRHVWAARRFAKAPYPGVDVFFLRRICGHGNSDLRRCIWGTLYTTFALAAPQWKGLLVVVLMAVIWGGYAPGAAAFLIPMAALILTGFINPPLYSEFPVAGSRRERLLGTMAQMFVLAGVSMFMVGFAVLVVNRVLPLLPVIEVADFRLSFRPIDFTVLLPVVVVFPIMGIVRVLFYWKPMGLMLGTMLLLAGMMVAAIVVKSVPWAYAAATAGIFWVVCFLVVYRLAMRSDLVRG